MQHLVVGSHLFPFATGYLAHAPKTLLLLLTFLLECQSFFVSLLSQLNPTHPLSCICYDNLFGDTHRAMAVPVSLRQASPSCQDRSPWSCRVIQSTGRWESKCQRGQTLVLHARRGKLQLPGKTCHHRGNAGEKTGLSRAAWKWEDLTSKQRLRWNRGASTPTLLKASRSCITINGFNHMFKCQMIPPNI